MSTDPTARALRLLGLLQAHRFWRGSELAERLGVSERTVRRDIDRLRELGYPVDASVGVDGGYQLAAGSRLPPLLVDDDEAIALAVGLQAAAVASIVGIEESSVRVMAKLAQILPDRLRRRVEAIQHSVEVLRWSPGGDQVSAADLTVLTQGCRDTEEVRFGYQRRDGEVSRRLVEPHQLVSVGRRWYLAAWDLRREDWRTFRVDRMDDVRLAGRRFAPRQLPAADAATYVAASLKAARPTDLSALLVVTGEPGEVRGIAGWLGADVEPIDSERREADPQGGAARFRVGLGAGSIERLTISIAALAANLEVEIQSGPPGLTDTLAQAGQRLANAASRTARPHQG
ncbi:MAG: transcriptional regulator [Microthrixaceae bacterium]